MRPAVPDMGDLTVRARMSAPVVVLPAAVTVEEALVSYFLQHMHSAFPVVDTDGRVTGLLTIAAVGRLSAAERSGISVGDVADGDPDLTVRADARIADVVLTDAFLRAGCVIAVDEDGKPEGLLSVTDLVHPTRPATGVRG